VPPGNLFLIGDGTFSRDSRQCGHIAADQVLGRVVAAVGHRLQPMPEYVELAWPSRRETLRYYAQFLPPQPAH
jgi:hypothetical protein